MVPGRQIATRGLHAPAYPLGFKQVTQGGGDAPVSQGLASLILHACRCEGELRGAVIQLQSSGTAGGGPGRVRRTARGLGRGGVAVARSVMRRPRLLLADEPTGNLDPGTGERVQDLLIDLNRETGASLVVATHNERFAGALGRCLRLERGRLFPVSVADAWTPSEAGGRFG